MRVPWVILAGKTPRTLFRDKLVQVRKFAKEENLEVIPIDTNLSEILQMNFQSTHTLRNLSCILTLQKLFKNYYYASPHRFDKYSLNSIDTGDYDLLNTNMLSTESVSFFSSSANLSRIERTELITNFPKTYTYLDVCTNSRKAGDFINCSKCDKCLRTALTLDLMGKLNLYEKVFDLEVYHRYKQDYIGRLIAGKKKDEFAKELYEFMKVSGKLPVSGYLQFLKVKLKGFKKGVQKTLKK